MKISAIIMLVVLTIAGSVEITGGVVTGFAATTIFQQLAGLVQTGFGTLTLAVIFGSAVIASKT